jgi:hypothetical protein
MRPSDVGRDQVAIDDEGRQLLRAEATARALIEMWGNLG